MILTIDFRDLKFNGSTSALSFVIQSNGGWWADESEIVVRLFMEKKEFVWVWIHNNRNWCVELLTQG